MTIARLNPDGSTTVQVFLGRRLAACDTAYEPWQAAARAVRGAKAQRHLFATGQRKRRRDKPVVLQRGAA